MFALQVFHRTRRTRQRSAQGTQTQPSDPPLMPIGSGLNLVLCETSARTHGMAGQLRAGGPAKITTRCRVNPAWRLRESRRFLARHKAVRRAQHLSHTRKPRDPSVMGRVVSQNKCLAKPSARFSQHTEACCYTDSLKPEKRWHQAVFRVRLSAGKLFFLWWPRAL